MSRHTSKKINLGSAYNTNVDERRIQDEALELFGKNQLKTNPQLFLIADFEDLPVFGPLKPIEKIISRRKDEGKGHSGGRILFTKDNYGPINSGVGGYGGTMCEAIDIVVGSLGCEEKIYTSKIKSRANFGSDAARIYLTERGDIGHYFGLKHGDPTVGVTSKLKSGIGVKADHTYIIGRERVRIVCGSGKFSGGDRIVGGNDTRVETIEIGHARANKMHSAVLGENLVDFLGQMNKDIRKLLSKMQELETKLITVEVAFAAHFHTGAGLGVVQTVPDPIQAVTRAIQDIPKYFTDSLANITDNYNSIIQELNSTGFVDGAIGGHKSILSSTVKIGE